MNECGHEGLARRACEHLRAAPEGDHAVLFLHGASQHALVCMDCRQLEDADQVLLQTLCATCFVELEEQGCWDACKLGVWGRPAALEGETRVRFAQSEFESIGTCLAVSVRGGGWLCIGAGGSTIQVQVDGSRHELPQIPTALENLGTQPTLAVSGCGHFAAIAGHRQGVLWCVESGEALLTLDRKDYHSAHTAFPLAFVNYAKKAMLIHATDWNRLDLFDVAAGRSVSQR